MLSCLRSKKMSRSIFLQLISTLNQPSVSLKLEQRVWLWQTLCVQLPVYVGSCWLLENYELQGHGELVRTKLLVMEPGVRRSAVRRRSSLATILIRIIIQTTQSFRHTGTGWLSDFSVTGSPTPAGDISVISRYSHSLKIAKFISMMVFRLDLCSYIVRKRIISFWQYYHRAAILLLQATKIPHEEKNLNLFR